MRVPSTAGVRRRWGSRVGPCRSASSYYGPETSLHAQAAMLMTPGAVHSLPLCSVSFRSYYSTLSFPLSPSVFRHSLLFLFPPSLVFSLSQRQPLGIAPPLFFLFLCLSPSLTLSLSAGFVFVVETGGHDTTRQGKAEEANLALAFFARDLAHVSGPLQFETCTPRVNSSDSGYRERTWRDISNVTHGGKRLDDRRREAISTSRAVLSKCRKNIRARRHVRVLPGTTPPISGAP